MKRFFQSNWQVIWLAFLIPFAASAESTVIERLEASVNNNLILLSDVNGFRGTQGLRAQLDPLFAGTTVAATAGNASSPEIVQFLVDERIISQQFPVNDSEVEQEINSILANNRISRPQLLSTLREQGYTYEEYFELIRASASKRNLIDRDIRTKVTISDDDVRNYFFNHYARNTNTAKTYRIRIITVNPRNYKTPAAAKAYAQQALSAVQGGESFEEVAKRVSDDPSAATGGELPILQGDQMSPVIREAIKGLKVGDVSEVVGSPTSAYMVVKLVDIHTADVTRFNQVKEEIRNQLVAAEYQHQIALWLERQRQNAFIHMAGDDSTKGLPR